MIAILLLALAAADPASLVEPRIGSSNGGNTFPGAVTPFGMVAFSPETTRGDATKTSAAGGYAWDARRIRGFALTHLSGTGCRGASGDIPFLPWTGEIDSSPSADIKDSKFAVSFAHVNERVSPGSYEVQLESGVQVQLSATDRTGVARFTFPKDKPAAILIRTSNSEVGSSDASAEIGDRVVKGFVSSGNFCGYIDAVDRRSYYTLHFVAEFDQPFTATGAWHDLELSPKATKASGGTGYGPEGIPPPGRGSGVWVSFAPGSVVNVKVGISYVSETGALANLKAEAAPLESARGKARAKWNDLLGRIRVQGGTHEQQVVFETALYHALLHPNLASDVDGQHWGMDQQPHKSERPQYANFSGWDVYRSQLQLVALLDPERASDIAQSLFEQAKESGGEWDRWTHQSGATHVMEGDPSPPAIADIAAFGGTKFDLKGAYESLKAAATQPTPNDLSNKGCPVECPGERPSLDQWLKLHYIPKDGNAWGGAGETLEDVASEFALAQLAKRLNDGAGEKEFLARSGWWRNVFHPERKHAQDRNADGSWPAFDAASDDGFAEGSSEQYTWMIPFDARGLFDAMGGDVAAVKRLDDFYHLPDGSWALTALGGLHAEMDNEPSTAAVWLYLFAGQPWKSQATIAQTMQVLWSAQPWGIPGNDDLGAMSAWYVWCSLGLYPNYPGRAELLVGTPIFSRAEIPSRHIVITARGAGAYLKSLKISGRASSELWLPESFVTTGGTIDVERSADPQKTLGANDRPPSFAP